MTDYKATIGLEIHAELGTKTKMFCKCANFSIANNLKSIKPNTHTCPVCLGLPGALPVPNLEAVKMTLTIAKALNCEIADLTKWDRKNYFYPDLPKGYQISQYDQPLASKGKLGNIDITRVHLEEDTGKLTHPADSDFSLVDFNRSGVPLVELVTEPVITSAQQAKAFAQEYQLILRYLGVSDADMEKGQMRVEANISINMGTKVEVKNLNSFRSVERAINYEIERQTKALQADEKIVQETRGWNDVKGVTFSQRIKETASDYRYFPEPDIPPLSIENLKLKIENLPDLPEQKRQKLAKIGIKAADIEVLVGDPLRLSKFEAVNGDQSIAILLVHRPETVRLSNDELVELGKLPSHLQKAKLSGQELSSVDLGNLAQLAKSVIKENSAVVADIKSGKSQAIGVLIGQVMAKTKGQADPSEIKKTIESML